MGSSNYITNFAGEVSQHTVPIAIDPLVEKTMSAYGYCNLNPVNLVDPDGRAPLDWILVTGDKTYWYGGNYGDKSNLKHTFKTYV